MLSEAKIRYVCSKYLAIDICRGLHAHKYLALGGVAGEPAAKAWRIGAHTVVVQFRFGVPVFATVADGAFVGGDPSGT